MSATKVTDLGTILGVWAHPDDETWACAGVMAAAIDNGQKVACVTATKGGAGKTADQKKWPKEHLNQIRETELAEALSIIGVHELYWLGHKDGQLAKVDKQQAVAKLAKIIDKICPDTILTFEPRGITGHDDHKVVCAWACAAARQSTCHPKIYGACETKERFETIGAACNDSFNIYFNTAKPFVSAQKDGDLVLELSRSQAKQKMAALQAHASQTDQFFNSRLGKKYIKKLCAVECFIKLEQLKNS